MNQRPVLWVRSAGSSWKYAKPFITLSVLAIALLGLPAVAAATEAGDVVSGLINQGSYYDFLANHLYAREGNNRADNAADNDLARDEIIAIFSGFGLSVEVEMFGSASYPKHNVIATQYGTVDPSVQYIVGAHYDSKNNPGADDDASGVAGLLELARVLSQFETAYTIKYIAFDAEEWGLLGSKFYVNNHLSDDIRGMIQMDMIAYDPNDLYRVNLRSYEASASLQTALADAFVAYSPLIYAIPSEGSCSSDHCPFESAGFQACEIIEEFPYLNPCYHQQCDTVDNPGYINYAYATDIVRGVAGFLADYAVATIPFDCSSGCAVSATCDQDCDANSLCDLCEIACLDAGDCNGNGVLDTCELAAGGLDCNGNSVLDDCDIASGFSTDCDVNFVPDECDLVADPAMDCNGNGIHDACDIRSEASTNCNDNGTPDECEIADDPSLDCDGNGMLDWCETSEDVVVWFPATGYSEGGASTFATLFPERAKDEVLLSFKGRGNLHHEDAWAEIKVGNVVVGNIFEFGWSGCDEIREDGLVVPASIFNDAIMGNHFWMYASFKHGPSYQSSCTTGFIQPKAVYMTFNETTDCNMDGLLDECQEDCNGNGMPDVREMCQGTLTDCNGNLVPDTCDVGDGTSSDCNVNGVPDACDIASQFSTDCDGNSVPDTCDLAADPALDCNSNGVHDACDIVSGTGSDCDDDGVLDECRIADDPSLDCDGGGTLDRCDVTKLYMRGPLSGGVVIGGSSSFVTTNAPAALSDVVVRVTTRGDLRHAVTWAEVQLNGLVLGNLFESSWPSCTEYKTQELTIPMDMYNVAAQAGSVHLLIYYRSASTAYTPCIYPNSVQAWIEYVTHDSNVDCNRNGVPDVCDIDDGTSEDCNANGIPDECQTDTCPPSPDPMDFEPGGEPHGISTSEIAMTAVEASDASGVEYQFLLPQGPAHASWLADRYFVHSGLMANAIQSYYVRARDKWSPPNPTQYSARHDAATLIQTPTGVDVSEVTDTTAKIRALGSFTNLDLRSSGCYFELHPPHGQGANVWLHASFSPRINATGLVPGTNYKVRVKARNQLAVETAWADWVAFRTTGDNPCTLCGDLDGDDDVDPDDRLAFRDAFGSAVGDANYNACADLDGDGVVTQRDRARFLLCYLNANPTTGMPLDPAQPTDAAPPSGPSPGFMPRR